MDVQGVLTLDSVESGERFIARFGDREHLIESGAGARAPSPVMALLEALAACEAVDVVSILRKKRQRLTAYEIEMKAERATEHPRRFVAIELVHRLTGQSLSESAVAEAIRLSDEKYCSVRHSLRPDIRISHRIELTEG